MTPQPRLDNHKINYSTTVTSGYKGRGVAMSLWRPVVKGVWIIILC